MTGENCKQDDVVLADPQWTDTLTWVMRRWRAQGVYDKRIKSQVKYPTMCRKQAYIGPTYLILMDHYSLVTKAT